jgi:hypothetical protein
MLKQYVLDEEEVLEIKEMLEQIQIICNESIFTLPQLSQKDLQEIFEGIRMKANNTGHRFEGIGE